MSVKKQFFLVLFIILFPFFVCATVEEYKKAVELDSENVIKRYNLALAYYNECIGGNQSLCDSAIEAMKKTLETNISDKESHLKVDATVLQILGILYYNYKQSVDEAIKYFNKCIEKNPTDGDTYYYTGLCYLRKNDNDNSLKFFMDAISKNTQNLLDAKFRLGQVYFRKKIYIEAIKYLEEVVKSNPKHLEARELLGVIYHNRNDSLKAIENLKIVVKYNPQNFNAFYLLGLNYFKEKQYDKMIDSYKKAIEINPDFPDAHYNLGMAYYYSNMYEEAIKEFEIAKKLNPTDSATFSILAQTKTTAYEYYLSKGTTYYTSEEYIKALKEFEKALNIKPGDSVAQKYLSNVKDVLKKQVPEVLQVAKNLFENKKYPEAYEKWNYVLQIDPENSEAKQGIANIEKNISDLIAGKEKIATEHVKSGNYSAALIEYEEIKNLVTSDTKRKYVNSQIQAIKEKQKSRVNSILAVADKLYQNKNYKSALNKYAEVLKFDPNNEAAMNGVIKINAKMEADKEKYLALGKQKIASEPDKAVGYFKKVLQIDPNNQEANSYIQKLTGKDAQVAIDAKMVKTLYYEGVDKYVNGNIEEAIKLWKKVLTIDPNHIESQKNIQRAQEKLIAIKNLGK
ncbi:MAG: tetratricopeptide repeat protein [Candidatus Goldbacteria bacterium]|nr:tetratricopeptide repeat protein [Candidatus Goldiibacteriota bacterium]